MSNIEISRSQRLDQCVVGLVPDISRAFAAKLIADGKVQVNGSTETKAGYKMREGDRVTVDYEPEEHAAVSDIDIHVLYEDADCVVIEKPVGLLTHSKGAYNPEATVATWLRSRINQLEGERAGIVHRLDRATSGVLICAKHPQALSWLQKQFSQRRVKKMYIAVVSGTMQHEVAEIDMPIERNPKKPQTFRVGVNGKTASTSYKVLQSNGTESLVELKPLTGRTHQLRVHLQHLGHPIVGDTLYSGTPAERLFLHAAELEITLPNRHREVFAVRVPNEFLQRVS